MTLNTAGSVYRGTVMHHRHEKPFNRFQYPLFSVLLDIDRLDEAVSVSRLISHNHFNLFAFYDRDHGAADGSALRPWIDSILTDNHVDLHGGAVKLLCMPRLLGYAFNPLSLWYCFGKDGSIKAVLCEVRNTFGERHRYLLHEHGSTLHWPLRQSRDKAFHVSPFLPMDLHYRFRISAPGEKLTIAMQCLKGEEPMLTAVQSAGRLPLSTPTLIRLFTSMPFMTFKVVFMIHWQALRLYFKKAPFYAHPDTTLKENQR